MQLNTLREYLREYFGALNELRAGIARKDMPPKPTALILYEQCNKMQIPLVSGGVMDQPHIWLLEWAVVQEELDMWKAVHERNNRHAAEQEQRETNARETSRSIF